MTKSIHFKSKLLVGVLLVLGLLILQLGSSLAAPPPQPPPPAVGNLPRSDGESPPPIIGADRSNNDADLTAQSVNLVVNYKSIGEECKTSGLIDFVQAVSASNWSSEARSAFEHALSIWAMLLNPTQSITINACWSDLGVTGPLGTGQPVSAFANFANAPQADTLYVVALANELAGTDLNNVDIDDHDGDGLTADAEIIIVFNSDISWYYGLDANPPGSQRDFVTVAVHEIGHGLGFISTMFVNTPGLDICETGDAGDGQGCWGLGTNQPAIYDRFVENGAEQSLLNTSLFPNPSLQLANALTGTVFFNGDNAKMATYSNARPELYAPAVFDAGSSILHLDQSVYQNTVNRMMTPIYAGPTHHPGPIVLGIFKDMGWNVVDLPPVTLTQSASSNLVMAGQSLTYTLTVTNTGYVLLTHVIITDTVPARATLVVDSLDSGDVITSGVTSGSVLTWTTGVTLTTGTALSRTFAVEADSDLDGVAAITNTAFVTSTAGVGAKATLATSVARHVYLPLVLKEN